MISATGRGVSHVWLTFLIGVAMLASWLPLAGLGPTSAETASQVLVELADELQAPSLFVDPLVEGLFDSAPVGAVGASGESARVRPFKYMVQPGDILARIAEQYGTDLPTLLATNEIDNPDLVRAGRVLTILPVRGVLYRVEAGDTLKSIAERHGLAVRDIMRANGLPGSKLLALGQTLVLPGTRPLVGRVAPRPGDWSGDDPWFGGFARTGPLHWPADGEITTYFREVDWASPRGHAGIDIAAPWGDPVTAAATGEIIAATWAGGPYGAYVMIDHGNGYETVYGHLSRLNAQAGDRVARGQIIGRVGSTGFSTGPHLHFEVRYYGELRDPLALLPELRESRASAGPKAEGGG